MHIIFRMMRHVKVDDMADLLDIDTARSDIGRDHDFISAVAKTGKGVFPFALGSARMQDSDSVAFLMQLARDPVSAVFGPAENQHPVSYTHLRAHETPEHLVCRLL